MKKERLPPLNALRAFEAVSRHGQVNRAATELSVSPSAVSHMLRKLEDDLNTPLVRRRGRSIELTAQGEALAPRLQEIFHSMQTLIKETRSHADTRTVTVVLRPYFAAKWLAPRLNRFWLQHPDIELRLHHSNAPVDFVTADADLAIEWSRGDRPGVSHVLLIPGELTPVFSPHLPSAGSIRTPADLIGQTLLMETDYDSWSDWFALAEVSPPHDRTSLFIDDSNVRNQAAVDAQGIELSCRTLVQDDVDNGRLLAPFSECLETFSYFLVQPVNSPLSMAAEKFRRWIIQEVSD